MPDNVIPFRPRLPAAPPVNHQAAMAIYASEVSGIVQASIMEAFVAAARVPGVQQLDLGEALPMFAAAVSRELAAAQAMLAVFTT